MSKLKYLNKNLSDVALEDLPLNVQENLLKLGLATILLRISVVIILILIIAMLLWFNKFTIFLTSVQFIFCLVIFEIRRSTYKKAKLSISQE